MSIEDDIRAAVREAMAQAETRIVEVVAVVTKIRQVHPHLSKNEIAELVIAAVSLKGGAVV